MSQSVLIVDDQDMERRGIRTLLEGLPEWRVCGEAQSGSEAIEKAARLHPDLIVLRVDLPDMNAAEVIPEIKHLCPASRILLLAMKDSGGSTAEAAAAGVSGLAMTSDTESDLLLTLQNIGRNPPYFSPEAVRLLQGQSSKRETSDALPVHLTARELEILKLLASGHTNKAIARSLDISVRTVDAHRSNIMHKLKLVTYSHLVQFALRHKIIEG